VHVDHHFRRRPFQYLQVMNSDFARRQVHILTLPSHLVCFAALYLDGRIWRRGLLDLTNKGAENLFELLFGHVDGLIRMRELAIGVEGISRGAQADNCLVTFI